MFEELTNSTIKSKEEYERDVHRDKNISSIQFGYLCSIFFFNKLSHNTLVVLVTYNYDRKKSGW